MFIYYLVVLSKFSLLHNSNRITFLTQSCLVFQSFCVSLLHSFSIRLTVSSLTSYNLRLRIINFCFDMIDSFGVVLNCYLKSFSFYFKVSLSWPFLCLFLCNLTSLSLEISKQLFFFPFLLFSFCCFSICTYINATAVNILSYLFLI